MISSGVKSFSVKKCLPFKSIVLSSLFIYFLSVFIYFQLFTFVFIYFDHHLQTRAALFSLVPPLSARFKHKYCRSHRCVQRLCAAFHRDQYFPIRTCRSFFCQTVSFISDKKCACRLVIFHIIGVFPFKMRRINRDSFRFSSSIVPFRSSV